MSVMQNSGHALFKVTINKRSAVCSSSRLFFSFFSLTSFFQKNANYRKEEKIVGMALQQNKLVYSVNSSIVFSPQLWQTL